MPRAWLIYGANGYTGELIAREAAHRGHRPILAGRNVQKIEALARELGCEWRVFDLAAPQLAGVELVLHCAGPFVETSAPMVNACLSAGAHYLDITGEISVFEAIFGRDGEAKARGVTLLPGVGFDVVPTDCLAARLFAEMPDAVELWLAFAAKGSKLSPGTTATMIESIGEGGAIRRDGRIVRVPSAFDVRTIAFSCGPLLAMTIPWGDIATAYRSTAIPNIRVYTATPPKTIARLERWSPLLPVVAFKPIRRLMQRSARQRKGPDAAMRTNGRMFLWGRVAAGNGEEVTMTMTTPEGYAFTVLSAVSAVERVLAGTDPGAFTPSQLLGDRFVESIPGVAAGEMVRTPSKQS